MTDDKEYVFKSDRLGFRNWTEGDIFPMSEINADHVVMEFFPSVLSAEQTKDFIRRMQKQFVATGHCYFAVDKLDDKKFIGFIGLSEQNYEADFTPCIDIGWRLNSANWNKGYATEGAKRCLEYAFNDLKIDNIYSVAPCVNVRSESIMKKIGMTKVKTFIHPKLEGNDKLEECNLYVIENK